MFTLSLKYVYCLIVDVVIVVRVSVQVLFHQTELAADRH